jgi:hypothetical protein
VLWSAFKLMNYLNQDVFITSLHSTLGQVYILVFARSPLSIRLITTGRIDWYDAERSVRDDSNQDSL